MASVVPTNEDSIRPATGFFMDLVDWVADWGRVIIETIAAIGDMVLFIWQTFCWMVTHFPRRGTLLPSFYQVGVLSLPVVAVTGTFFGMIVALQVHFQFHSLGLESRLGAVINMALVRELGPVLAAVMLAGRVGSSMAAELGTMKVTEQIDALSSMGINPIHYLVVPRFLACLILIPILTIMADFMGVVGGYFYSVIILEIDKQYYWTNSSDSVDVMDIAIGVIKSLFFGCAIALISCYRGFRSSAGAEGVGHAATVAFVHSFLTIIALDFLIALALDSFHHWFH